jgi:CRISPR-associated protein Csb3
MAEASIPVSLFNPGQVFASLGFLEAADVLLGDAEGGFDWSDEANVRFRLRASGDRNPFGIVLGFLATAEIRRCGPDGYADPPPKKGKKKAGIDDDATGHEPPERTDTFPAPVGERLALPIRLAGSIGDEQRCINVGHWADASSRNDFKLYAGNRSAAGIARAMLEGARDKPKKNQTEGDLKTRGVGTLWKESRQELEQQPFDVLTAVGGSFNFDPRGAWTGIDAGYSPNDQKHGVAASPVVEILAAIGLEHARPDEYDAPPSRRAPGRVPIGLEHARPDEYDTRKVRYAAWGCLLPPPLARPALACEPVGASLRTFRFELSGTKHNKIVTFAQEEISS